jgi:hypothetical protein
MIKNVEVSVFNTTLPIFIFGPIITYFWSLTDLQPLNKKLNILNVENKKFYQTDII